MDYSRQAYLSMGFSGQENWSGLLFPSPGGLPDPGIEPTSPALAGRFFTVEAPGRLLIGCYAMKDLNTKKWISLLKTRPGRTGWPECPDQSAGTPWFSPGTSGYRSSPFLSHQDARVVHLLSGRGDSQTSPLCTSPVLWVLRLGWWTTRRRQGTRQKTVSSRETGHF